MFSITLAQLQHTHYGFIIKLKCKALLRSIDTMENVIEATLETEKKQKIADCITSILQDVAAYMRQSGAQNF